MDTTPLWLAGRRAPGFHPLSRDLVVDVAIVGGGISGMTAAVLLSRSGLRVAVLERHRIGGGETSHTTSHLTEAVDARYKEVIDDFGLEAARLVAQSSRVAIAQIESLALTLGVDCGFERIPGYLYTEESDQVSGLADELDAARRADCAVEWVDDVPVPFETRGGVRWDGQAQVHPAVYLEGLAADASSRGVLIHEETPVIDVRDGDPCHVHTERGSVAARYVVVAANVPVNNRVLLHTKIAAYRSYAIAAEVKHGYMRGLFWDTDDPYHYTRPHEINGRSHLIIGGEDHRTGEERDTVHCYERLLDYARERYPIGPVTHRWSGQIIEPADGLPYIGRNSLESHVFVATGYAGNGMTFGTLAGMMAADFVQGLRSPYAELYDATRVKPIAAAADYVAENMGFPVNLLKHRLSSANADLPSLDDLRPGKGGIFKAEDGKLAVYRDAVGELHACSPVCTHLACDVAWNRAEATWDCPCHGSRFSPDGDVINGPAVTGLEPRPLSVSSKK